MADELKDQRIPVMMSPSEVRAIDDWMFKNRIRSRSEAIRVLISNGLMFETTEAVAEASKGIIKIILSGGQLDKQIFDEWLDLLELNADRSRKKLQIIEETRQYYIDLAGKSIKNEVERKAFFDAIEILSKSNEAESGS